MPGETLTLTIQPDWGLPVATEPRVHRVDFGDDYVQRAPWGININPKELNLTFSKKTTEVANNLIDVFSRASGGTLYYTLPFESVARSYDILKYTRVLEDYNAETVTASLKETADSDAFDVNPLDDYFTTDSGRWVPYRMTGGETSTVAGGLRNVASASFGGSPDPRGMLLPLPLQGKWSLQTRMRHVCDHPTGYYDFWGVHYDWPDHGIFGVLNSYTGKVAALALGRPGYPTNNAGASSCRTWTELWNSPTNRQHVGTGIWLSDAPGGNLNRSWTSPWFDARVDVLLTGIRVYKDATTYQDYTYDEVGGRPDFLLIGNISRNTVGYQVTPYGKTEFDYVKFLAVP